LRLIPRRPAWLRLLRRPPSVSAALALPGLAGYPLAADSITQVISNTTIWIVGILAGLATLFLTIAGVRYLAAGGDPAEVEKPRPRCGPPRSATAWRSSPRSSSPS